MRTINRDSLPHLVECLLRIVARRWNTLLSRLSACWWGVELGTRSAFNGSPRFRRHPGSSIAIGAGCTFNSAHDSNLIGVNRPCLVSTLKEGAQIMIGSNCGFSGTVIASALKVEIGDNVMCGANTLINDTDWHSDDPRTGPDAPVIIGSGVWLGVNVTVMKGVVIGENTLVAAGSVVTKSLPANVIAGGVPAKIIRQLDAVQVVDHR